MKTHELKCDPGPFYDLLIGKKRCEVRKDDRGFRKGDRLWLRETSLSAQGNAILRQEARYTGRELYRTITHIQRGYGLPDGVVVLSVSDAPERAQHAGEARELVCRTCNGRGTVNRWERVGESDFDEWEDDCPVCGGAGNAPEHVQKLHDQLIATRQDLHNVQMRIATADLKSLIAAPQPAALPEGLNEQQVVDIFLAQAPGWIPDRSPQACMRVYRALMDAARSKEDSSK